MTLVSPDTCLPPSTPTWSRLIRFSLGPRPAAPDSGPSADVFGYGEPVDSTADVGLALASPDQVDEGREGCEGRVGREGKEADDTLGAGVEVWLWEFVDGLPWNKGRRTGKTHIVRPGELLTPVPADRCGAIRCIGLNYKDHAAELNLPYPPYPEIFLLAPSTLAPPGGKIIVPEICQSPIPERLVPGACIRPTPTPTPYTPEKPVTARSPPPSPALAQVDYEVELAFVLGRDARNVREEDAMGYVLGFTAANDVTERRWQGVMSQWSLCKGFDTFLPLGPCLVAPPFSGDGYRFSLETYLAGEKMQEGCTSRMIWSVPQLIAHMSCGTTLPAGTVVITGTPPGIGASKAPQRWMRDGEVVRCVISGGVGSLVSTVVFERESA